MPSDSAVTRLERTATGIRADVGPEIFRVDVVTSAVVRLAMSRQGRLDDPPTYAVCVDPLASPPDFDVSQTAGGWRVTTAELEVAITAEPFDIAVARRDGTPVLAAPDGGGGYRATVDGFVLRRSRAAADAFYGLGEKGGAFDRAGRDFTMWNTDVLDPNTAGEFIADRAPDDPRSDRTSPEFDPMYAAIPLLYHHPGGVGAMSASFVDNAFRARYDLRAPDEFTIEFAGGQWIEYVFAGPGMPAILSEYTALTGRMTMPQDWALGYHQCRWRAYDESALEALADRFVAEDIPCAALWLDIEHMDGYRVFTWNTNLFPDPTGMMARLSDKGFRVVTIVDPGVKHEPGYPTYDDGLARDLFCRNADGELYLGQVWPGLTAFPDFVRPEVREWWGALNAAYVATGVAGIWNDMNEPATGSVPPDAMAFDRGREPHARYHNQYALLMAMATHDGLTAARPDETPFILSRAGFAGIQRYAANWLGDNFSRWDHLAAIIPMACGLGVSGQPFVGADIGGFMGDTTPELFARWMQVGTLTPFCRNHTVTGTIDQYPWSFGPEVLRISRDAICRRYALLPYLRACFAEAAATGAPVQRPMVFDHQDDPEVRGIDDQFFVGRDLLVAPILREGVRARDVYLPEGTWREVMTGALHPGRSWVRVEAPLDTIPLFVAADALRKRAAAEARALASDPDDLAEVRAIQDDIAALFDRR